MFQIFGEGLKLTVRASLGRCYNEHAWDECVAEIEDGIKS